MIMIARRAALLATVAAVLPARKPHADEAGGLTKLHVIQPPVAPPAISFVDADGQQRTLKQYLGSVVVLNLWASWCAPCTAELPSLDALAAKVAGQGIVVLALSSDHGGAMAVRKFYQDHGIKTLPILLDPEGAALHALGVQGIPATFLIGRDGLERASIEGAADWATAAAISRIKAVTS